MRFSRVTAAMLMASLSSPLFAAGAEQSVGKLTSASAGTFVSRGGKLIPATAGQSLYAGDRVVTRGQAKAKVAFPGCSYTMAPTSVLSVNASSCASAPKSFAQDDGTTEAAGAGGGIGAEGGVIAGLALIAAGTGIYFGVKNDESTPASP